MSRGFCSPEAKAACPLTKHYSDLHHLSHPASDYKTKVEKVWRDLPINKVQVCRAVHDAIHYSGYVPEKPDREVMLSEIWSGGAVSLRAIAERNHQLELGRAVLENL